MYKKIAFLLVLIIFIPSFSYAHDYDNHWAKTYIENAMGEKVAFGSTDGNFYPDNNITRAEFIALLINYMLKYDNIKSSSLFTSFNDIMPSAWYFPHIVIAEENKIIKGMPDGGFHPNDTLTREDAVVFACRAYKLNPSKDSFFKTYADSGEISEYAENFVQYSVNNKILVGYENNTLKPKNPVTRAEALIIIDNFKNISPTFNLSAEFSDGYPKISPTGEVNYITVELKTTKPCTIYYKSVKKGDFSTYVTPPKDSITDFLAYISDANTPVTAVIPADLTSEEYNLFLMPIAQNGEVGTIKRIKDVRPLAYDKGDGSRQNPYLIFNEGQLNNIRYCQGNYFKLANNISLTKEWIPINASGSYYTSLDGDGHTISDLNISAADNNVGLFSVLSNGEIKNLAVKGSITGGNCVGLFAGKLENARISGCISLGDVKGSSNVGGIVGTNNGEIINSLSAVLSVNAAANAGGIAGNGNGDITKCLSAVKNVTADMYAGCIAGIISDGEIKSCVSANLKTESLLYTGSGRITTAKENGRALNNYVYDGVKTTTLNINPDKNNNNGAEISWNSLSSREFYNSTLGFDFFSDWQISAAKSFVLPFPKAFSDVDIESGITPYAPLKIKSESGLYSMIPDLNYLLVSDINTGGKWAYCEEEFTGTFNGGNHTISGLNLSSSMFGTITDGTVRNLKIKNVSSSSPVIASFNYGTIENCSVTGNISDSSNQNESLTVGSIAGINYGNILSCNAEVDFDIFSPAPTVGGIVSHNEGFVNDCSYIGKSNIISSSSASFGGICGFNNEGFIYSSYAKADAVSQADLSYVGGICGILSSGEIFKCSSNGFLKIAASGKESVSYAGGIAAMAASGLIYSGFSAAKINTSSAAGYSGGLCGYNISANIQGSYSVNTILQSSNSHIFEKGFFAAGICGFNESGFISDNAAINPWIIPFGESKKISCSPEEYLSNNYSLQTLLPDEEYNPQNGNKTSLKTFYDFDFYFRPVHKGGKLGWQADVYEKNNAVWTKPENAMLYKFPVLKNVKNQFDFKMPDEYKQ